jgi:hypothetical protein
VGKSGSYYNAEMARPYRMNGRGRVAEKCITLIITRKKRKEIYM